MNRYDYDFDDNSDVVVLPKVGSRKQKVLCLVGTAIAGLAVLGFVKHLHHKG